MGNAIVIGILLIIVWRALVSAAKHFKGQGGCCGGDNTTKEHKKLEGKKLGEWRIQIEGMHCENCKNRIEHAVNRLDGIVCKVNLKKNLATVQYSIVTGEDVVKNAIENLGYKVIGITQIK